MCDVRCMMSARVRSLDSSDNHQSHIKHFLPMYDRQALVELIRAKSLGLRRLHAGLGQEGELLPRLSQGDARFARHAAHRRRHARSCCARTCRRLSGAWRSAPTRSPPPSSPSRACGASTCGASWFARKPSNTARASSSKGPFAAGEEVAIVEDVVTTGGSSLLAIERCEAVGLKVRRVLAIVDRLEGGREAFAARGYELTTLCTVADLGVGSGQ